MSRIRMVGSHRLAILVLAVVTPGLFGVEILSTSAAVPERGVPVLSLPEVSEPLPAVPAREGTPGKVRPKVLSAAQLPRTVRELTSKRSANGEAWQNADGTQTVKMHQGPIHFQPAGSTRWERIDTGLVADSDRPGWVRTNANSWTARFGPLGAGGAGGVELTTAKGTARFAPETSRSVLPEVAGDKVTYRQVWPGVDVVYSVSATAVKEDIVVADGAQASYPFVVDGLEAAGAKVAGLEVLDGKGRLAPIKKAGAKLATQAAPAGLAASSGASANAKRLVVSVDAGWLRSQAAGDKNVVVDPTVVLGASALRAEKLDPIVGQVEYGCNLGGDCRLRVGNSKDSYWTGGDALWHSAMTFPYWDQIQGKQILHAGIWLDEQSGPSAWWEEPVRLWRGIGMDYGGSVAHGHPDHFLDEAWPGATSGPGWPPDVVFDLTYLMQWWQLGGINDASVRNAIFGFSGRDDQGDSNEQYSFKQFEKADMVLVLNTPPPAPGLVGPANNSLTITDTTPTLSWNPVTDADGDPVKYIAKIATGTDGESGLVATSPEDTATSWTVPDGVLQDGVTYTWKVLAKDANTATPSQIRKLTVDRRLGAGEMSPSDAFGGVATNLVTGNASVTVVAPDMPSLGGGVGVDFVYNAQQRRRGLVGTYRDDVDKDRVIEDSDPVKMVRTDARISFDWTKWDPSPNGPIPRSDPPSPGVPHDWYSVRWAGYITLPAGDWQLGVSSDDGVRVRIDGATVIDKWLDRPAGAADYEAGTRPGGRYAISIDYYEATLGASIHLYAKQAGQSWAVWVPSTWLSPETRDMPKGWSLQAGDMNVSYVRAQVSDGSVTLVGPDGSTFAFAKTPSGGYRPPEGVEDVITVGGDGRITVNDDEGYTYLFRNDGGLESITAVEDDRKPAATRATYDNQGRISVLTDPVSGRSVTLTYAAANSDPACPNTPPITPTPTGFASVKYLLCKVSNWDNTATELYYKNGLLAYVRNPGDAYWGFSYDTTGRLIGHHDPSVFDAAQSGARTDTAKLVTTIGYDTAGRVATVTEPPAKQSDTAQPKRTYGYAPAIGADGMLTGGTATVTRAGLSGVYRTVGYDFRGRHTTDTNPLGQKSTTYWDGNDLQAATETPDGLIAATHYNSRKQPTDSYGPAPKAWFDTDFAATWGIWKPKPEHAAAVPRTQTRYDEGIDGLQEVWWNSVGIGGSPILHRHNPGPVDETWPAGTFPPGTVNGDNITARLSGQIAFGAPGGYKMRVCAGANDLAALYVDDHKVGDIWAVPNPACSPDSVWHGVGTFWPGERRRIRIDFVDIGGADGLRLEWAPPGQGWQTVPGGALLPGYDLVTSTTDAEGKTTKTEYSDTAAAIGPQHGLAVRSITDPGGLNLTQTTGYEPVGTGYLRRKTHTLPGGADTKTTNTYYGDTQQVDNPCTPENDPANQGGMVQLDTSADPDGTGTQTALVRENVFDKSGRVVASRVATEPWTCTKYDARGEVVELRQPAFGGQPARIETTNHTADPDGSGPRVASPMVTAVTDAAGTIITETDLLGRVISYKDVFGNTTIFTYDLIGRETANSGPVGLITRTYDSIDRLASLSRGSAVLAEGFGYDAANRLKAVSYPTGTGKAGNGTAGAFENDTYGRLKKITWTGPGGALLTSDEVTRRLGGDITGQKIDGVDHHAGDDYVYDNASRLVDAWTPGRHVSYQYAATGGCGLLTSAGANTNRTRQIIEGGATTNYCYDRADRLTSASDAAVDTLTYDSHGNTTGIFRETHTYDAADRHVGTTKGGTTVTYVRDATDRIIERRVNGFTVARYGSTGSGDAPEFTTNETNQVLEVTFSLPGGALLTTRAAGNVWSYPNSHGDVVATANQAGVKQGATVVYDPFGNRISGADPDNSHGNLDYGWLGQHQRPLEHEPTLQPIIEMGARQYSPLLGRFLEVDPVEGGSSNDYEYTNSDPVNTFDLDGEWGFKLPKIKINVKKWAKRIRKVARVVSYVPGPIGTVASGVAVASSLAMGDWKGAAMDAVGLAGGGGGKLFRKLGGRLVKNFRKGKEYPIGKNLRLAPFGNRTGHPTGRFPHYHRRAFLPNGKIKPGGGLNRRHRPWDKKPEDKSFWDRF